MSDTPTNDIQTIEYFTKEQIGEKTGISPHTLQNWINSYKPVDSEFETLRGGKRTYSSSYIKKIFTKAFRQELLPKLWEHENPTSSHAIFNQWSSAGQGQEKQKPSHNHDSPINDAVINLVNQRWQASVTGKEEVVDLLKEQLITTKQQVDIKDGQIADLSKSLNQQQILQMETVKEIMRLREENKNLLLTSHEAVTNPVAEPSNPNQRVEAEIVHNTPKPQPRKKWWQF